MKKVTIQTKLTDFQKDWGGTYHDGALQPYPEEVTLRDGQEWGHKREDVERVIKENANKKFGYALVSTDQSTLIVTVRFFKDKKDGDYYEQDPIEYKDLVLKEVSFQGSLPPAEYTLAVGVTQTPVANQVAGVDNFFSFTYNSYWGGDPTDLDTDPGHAILKVNDEVKEVLTLQSGGNTYSFNIGKYILETSSKVNIEIGNSHDKVRYWNYSIQALILRLNFSDSFLNQQFIAKHSNWEFRLDTVGVESTVYVRVDDGNIMEHDHVVGSTTFMIDTDDVMVPGSHLIEAWAIDPVYGMQTEHLVTHFIKAGGSSNVLVLGINPPKQTTLYDVTNIPFFFYAPNTAEGDSVTVTIVIKTRDNQEVSRLIETIAVDELHSSGIQNAIVHIMDNAYSNQTLVITISISGSAVTHEIFVNEAEVSLQQASECKVYYNLNEKTNFDADVVANDMKSTYNGVVTSHLRRSSNFVLKDGVGFIIGEGGCYIPPGKTLTLEDWQPFATDFGVSGNQQGKTISMEFKAGISSNNDVPIISCMDDICGFKVYPNRIDVEHGGSQAHVYSYFTEGERVSFTLVINGTTTECVNDDGNGHREVTYKNLAFLYLNAVMVRIFEYKNESWEQIVKKNIVFGSPEAGVTIYSISGWDKAITMKEVVNNFAFDTPLLADKIAIAKRNNILLSDGSTIDVNKLHEALPNTPIITWFMEKLPTSKKDPQECKETEFVNPTWDKISEANAPFTAGSHEINGDGTSSNAYPLPYKNWAEKFSGLTLHLLEGDEEVQKYSITYGIPKGEKKFVHKVNFASSEGIFNILAMTMYQELTISASHTIDDILSKQQQEQADSGHEVTFRKSLSGFPEIGLRKHTVTGEVKIEFLSIYNFINNKKTGSMFGMDSDDYKKNQLWEIDENRNFFVVPMTEHTIVEGQVVESNGVREDEPLYYSRVPADSPINGGDLGMCANITQVNQANDEIKALRHIHNWIYSINPNVAKRYYARYGHYRNLTEAEDGWTSKDWGDGIIYTQDTPQYRAHKFLNEYSDHLHLNDCIFYFVFCTWILGKDSMDKNMSLFLDTLEDFYSDIPDISDNAKVKLRIMLRDTDTTNMFNNTGVLMYKYWHEWNDTYNENTGETGVITGEVWDGTKYVVQSSVEGATPVFNGRLSGLWDAIVQYVPGDVRTIYQAMRNAGLNYQNMMAMYKRFHDYWCEVLYNVDGLGYANTGNLNMAYGDKYLLSEYFYKYRERYMDSKYGVFNNAPRTTMRLSEVPAGIWLKHATPMYASFSYGAGNPVTARSIVVGEPAKLPCNSDSFNDAVCYINDADLVTEIGVYTQSGNNTTYHGLEALKNFHFDVAGFANLIRLRKFIWANIQSAPNVAQTSSNGNIDFSHLLNLQELVMTYCVNWNGSPVIGSEIIEKVDFTGTPISNITIPETETLTELRLPDSIVTLNLVNLPNLTTFSIQGVASLESVEIENTPLVAEAVALALVSLVENGGTPVLTSGKLTLSSISDTNFWKLYDALGEDVFDPESDLYIEVPAGVYIRDTKPVFEAGQSQTIQAISIPLNESTTIEYQLIENDEPVTPVEGIATSTGGSTLNVSTGLLTSVDDSPETIIVRAKATTEGVDVYSDELTINANVYTYPTAIGINGDFWQWEAGSYSYTRTITGDYDAEIDRVEWSLTNANNAVEILSKSTSSCVIRVISVGSAEIEPILTCKVKFKTGHEMTGTLRMLIQNTELRFIDLDLPTGRLWANLNLRASTPASPGLFYSFGEITGYAKWQDKDPNVGFTAATFAGISSGSITDSTDAAFQYSNGEYRMPTRTEFLELIDPENTTAEIITLHNIVGALITSKSNQKRIFIPEVGSIKGKNTNAYSVTLSRTASTDVRFLTGLMFQSSSGRGIYISGPGYNSVSAQIGRECGMQIRPVK